MRIGIPFDNDDQLRAICRFRYAAVGKLLHSLLGRSFESWRTIVEHEQKCCGFEQIVNLRIMQQIFKLWTVRTIAQRGVRRFAVHLKQGVRAVYFRGWREGMHHQQAILQPRLEQLAACIKTRSHHILPHAVTTIGEPGTERRAANANIA